MGKKQVERREGRRGRKWYSEEEKREDGRKKQVERMEGRSGIGGKVEGERRAQWTGVHGIGKKLKGERRERWCTSGEEGREGVV